MRLRIDLRPVQAAGLRGAAARGAVGLARAILRSPGPHDVGIVVSADFPEGLDAVRAAFGNDWPADRVSHVPPIAACAVTGNADGWLGEASRRLHASHVAALACDVVLASVEPGGDGGAGAAALIVQGTFAVAVSLHDEACAQDDGLRDVLGRAARVLVPTEQLRARAIAQFALAPERVVAIGAEADALCAARALDALAEAVPPPAAARPSAVVHAGKRRLRLAYVSPLPPERSGIADYSAELLPFLARRYEIDCVVDQPAVDAKAIDNAFVVRQAGDPGLDLARYDRFVYHFGNSPFHRHMFALLARHPGVVVLHDFFVGFALHAMETTGYAPGAFRRALYASHGYPALVAARDGGVDEAAWTYPCSLEAIAQSTGALVHSAYGQALAGQWYGTAACAQVARVPFPRRAIDGAGRRAARERLGFGHDDVVVCSFGYLGRTKLNREMLDAWESSRMRDHRRAHLVFVGDSPGGDYCSVIEQRIASFRGASTVRLTGFAHASTYRDYLLAADFAVQLRAQSRGETSAAVLDCIAAGVPLIVNAHGAAAELPGDVVVQIAEGFGAGDLAAALDALAADPARRQALARAAREYHARVHDPARVADDYFEAIERMHEVGWARRRQDAIDDLARIAAAPPPDDQAIVACARSIAALRPHVDRRRLFVDVSIVARDDLRTGIQRVVRGILGEYLRDAPAGFRVEPIVDDARGGFAYARRFAASLLDLPPDILDDEPVDPRPGDVYLGLDWIPDRIVRVAGTLRAWRAQGVRVVVSVYDLLPVLMPGAFPPGADRHYAEWLSTVAQCADGVVCISRAVADEVCGWLDAKQPNRSAPLGVGVFALGSDLLSHFATSHEADDERAVAPMRERPTFLMVGTVEPRKAHRQALAAFERLWADGVDAGLVIVGKSGWLVDDLAPRIRGHAEHGRRLAWHESASDHLLDALYRNARALLVPSEGEGYGLPIIEAARHGVPVIARDLPVFREIAGDHVHYFEGRAPADLASAIVRWLDLYREGRHPRSERIRASTWRDSATQLSEAALDGRWYRHWTPSGGAVPGETLAFDDPRLRFVGWSPGEDAFRWSDGSCASIRVRLADGVGWRGRIRLQATSFGRQRVFPRWNGVALGEQAIAGDQWIALDVGDTLAPGEDNELALELPDACSAGKHDPRRIALAFRALHVE